MKSIGATAEMEPVQKTFQAGKNRQKLTGLLGDSLPVRGNDLKNIRFFAFWPDFIINILIKKNIKLAHDVIYSETIAYLKNCEIHFLTKT